MSVEGRLVAEASSGLGLRQRDGTTLGVVWPNRWSARRESDGIVLLDIEGQVVAREGDFVVMDGWATEDHLVVVGR
jgi:hypothetical protein